MGQLLELERELAGVMTLRDMSGTVLDSIERLVGASGSTLFAFDEFGALRTLGGSLEGAMSSYTLDLVPEDAMQQWSMRMPGSMFISDGRDPNGGNFDFKAHVRSRPFVDFYRPLDIGLAAGVWPTGLTYGYPHMFGLLLTKSLPFRPFEAAALAKLRRLEIPLRLAARRIQQFGASEQRADVLGRLLARQAGSFALWDAEGRMVWASADAQRLLEGKLRRSDLDRAARVAQAQLSLRRAARETLLGRARPLRSVGGSPMLVAFSWIAGSDQRPWLLAEIEECSRLESPLRRLTDAEVGVLRLLERGLSNAEICQQLAVGNETVKTHLKRIFVKLGVSSRAKAVAVARDALALGSSQRPSGRW